MYSLQCVFISQYSNQVDFISMGEAKVGEMGSNPKLGAMAPFSCFWSLHEVAGFAENSVAYF